MLLRQTLAFLPAQLLGPLAQFVAVIAWTYWLPPATYGLIALILAGQELVYQACLSWWTHYTMRYLGTLSEADRRTRYQPVENAVLLASIPAQIGLVVGVLAWKGHAADPGLLAAATIYAFSRGLVTQLAEHARSRGEVLSYTLAQTAGPVFGFALGALLVPYAGPDPAVVIGAFALVQVVSLPILARSMALGDVVRFDPAVLRAAGAFGLPLLVTGVIGWIAANGIRVIVDHESGAAAVGLLSVGWGLGQRLSWVVSMTVTSASFPLAVRRLAQAGRRGALDQVAQNGTFLAALMLPATAGTVCLAGPFVQAVVGPTFWDATIAILPVAMLAAATRNLRTHWADQVFYLTEEPGILLRINVGEAAATVGLCWLGLRWGGLVGACLGCLVASAGAAVVGFTWAIRRHRLAVDLVALAKIVLATGAMALLIRQGWFPPGTPGLALRIAAGMAVYVGLMAVLFRGDLPALRLRTTRA